MADDKILKKIKALLARTEIKVGEGATQAQIEAVMSEAAVAASLVQELCFTHKINLDDVYKEVDNTIVERDLMFEKGIRQCPTWERFLAAAVCRHCFCQLFTTSHALRFVGTEHDIQVAFSLLEYLREALHRVTKEAWKVRKRELEAIVDSGVTITDRRRLVESLFEGRQTITAKEAGEWLANPKYPSSWRFDFLHGAVKIIDDRLEQMRAKLERDAVSKYATKAREAKERDRAPFEDHYVPKALPLPDSAFESRALVPIRKAQTDLEKFVQKYADVRVDRKVDVDLLPDETAVTRGMIAGRNISLNRQIR